MPSETPPSLDTPETIAGLGRSAWPEVLRPVFCLRTLWLAVAALLGTGAAPADPAVIVSGNWIAGCDNTNICTAIAASPRAGRGDPVLLKIRHHPNQDAIPEITVIAPDGDAAFAELIFAATPERVYRALPDSAGAYRILSDDAWAVLIGLRSDRPLRIRIGAAPAIAIDTHLLDPALVQFDREQDLEGTPGALVTKPDGMILDYWHPRPPEAPAVKLRTAVSVDAPPRGTRWDLAEGPCARGVPGSSLTSEWWLDDRNILIQRNCPLANAPTQWFIERAGDPVPHPVDWPGEPRPSRGSKGVLYGAFFFASEGIFRATRHIGGRADCGITEAWAWEGEAFAMIDRREMPVCRGIPQKHWIVTYRADTISPD
jgi:hypothetical protein